MSTASLIGDYDNPASIGSKFRQKRSAPLRKLISEVYRTKGSVIILDVGGTERYWKIFPKDFLRAHKVQIVILNCPDDILPVVDAEIFETRSGNGCSLPYGDNEFDICHSNSVIEHVGGWDRKVAYAKEVTRVAPHYWHQTPNYWFVWEPHFGVPFIHWLPEPVRVNIAMHKRLGTWPKAKNVNDAMLMLEDAALLDQRMFVCLFPHATLIKERMLGITKSFIGHK